VRDPEVLADYLRLSLGGQKREKFRVFFLNKKLEILDEKDLFEGTVDETAVYPREIVEKALRCHATAVILAHNHPSGRLQPSPEDIRVTEKITAACGLINVRVIDHVIVSSEGYFSFSSEGILSQS
jgi:DNA repair protein RadC